MAGKGKIGDLLRKAHAFVKDRKLISTHLPKLLAMSKITAPYAATAGHLAATAGYGRRRRRVRAPARPRARAAGTRRRRTVRGGSVGSWLRGAVSKVGNYLQNSKFLSKNAGLLGVVPGLAPYTGLIQKGLQIAGLGSRRRMRGRGMPIGLPAGIPQGTSQPYYPMATAPAFARF